MSNQYKAIQWNRQKKRYDKVLGIWIMSFLLLFAVLNSLVHPEITMETLIIRAFGLVAIFLLHIILAIGPLSRINPRFHVLLYNRRHLGVTMFFLAFIHGVFSIIQFHGFGNENALVSVFTSNKAYYSLVDFPFQTLGFVALIIFMLMAATSHDFWLKNLTPAAWKYLHMLVYLAYALVVMHVMLGAAQDEKSIVLPITLLAGVLVLSGLHLYAAQKDREFPVVKENWVEIGTSAQLTENSAVTVSLANKKVAVFRYQNSLSAVSNYCRHQGGPIGEGKIIDGCITCPWHGYQYFPHNGCSPPPFEEKLETYHLKMEGGRIMLNTIANAAGTEVAPLKIANDKIDVAQAE